MRRRAERRGRAGGRRAGDGPGAASAHGLVGKQDLPIPRWLFAWGAAVVLVVSFVGLAVLWPKPRLEGAPERRVVARAACAREIVFGAIGVAAFAISVYAGFAGVQSATANLLPTWSTSCSGSPIPFASLLFGEVFAPINPWRAVARAAAWAFGRAARRGARPRWPIPAWLGQWPAALGILAFAWLELVYTNKDDPTLLAGLALAYAAVQLVGMSLFGITRVGAQRRCVRRLLRLLRAPRRRCTGAATG